MTTFSQLVDKMKLELRRPEMTPEIVSYLNQTVREMHFDVQTKGPLFYDDNLVEEIVTGGPSETLIYDLPKQSLYQGRPYVRYASVFRNNGPVSPIMLKPGQRMSRESHYYYRVPGGFCFIGFGGINARIELSYHNFCPSLAYHEADCRPLTIDELGVYVYHEDYCSPEDQEIARCLSTHWMLLRWTHVIEEGTRAKLYKRTGDVERARLAYSAYLDNRQQMVVSEGAGSEDYHR